MSAVFFLRRAYSSKSSLNSTYNVIFKEKDLKKVVETFKKHTQNSQMRKKTSFYEYTVTRLADSQSFNLIEEILEDQKQYKDITDEGFTVRLISLYGKSKMFDHAHKLFDEMPQLNCKRTTLSFNALLSACVNSKNFDKVDGFFRELPDKLSIKPDNVSYNNLIKAYCEMGSLDSATLMFDEMQKNGLKPDLITFNILLDGFYKKGNFLGGEKFWVLMEKYGLVPDSLSYDARLNGFVTENMIQEAVNLVQEMKSKDMKIHGSTYNILFKGLCSDGKNIDEAKKWAEEVLKTKGLIMPNQMLSTLIRFFCDNNDFRFASRLSKSLLHRNYRLKECELLQGVVNGLVKQKNMKDAEILVRLGKDSKLSCYHKLKMPKFEQK
ncbi:unnamed protein product [Amaranthus hypochondriacus]